MVYGSKLYNQGTRWIKTGRPPAIRAPPGRNRQTVANGHKNLVFTLFILNFLDFLTLINIWYGYFTIFVKTYIQGIRVGIVVP